MAAQGPTASMLPIGFTEEDFWDIPWKSCYEPKWNEPEWGQNGRCYGIDRKII